MGTTNGTGTGMVVHGTTGPGLAKVDTSRAFEPHNIEEGYHIAKLYASSGLLPRGAQRPEAAFAIIATGRELGLTAMQSLRSIHIIEGKPTLSADLIAGLCKQRPDVCAYFRLVESTAAIATYETQRKGEPSPTRMSFTWEDAQRAGVTGKDNWRKYPAAMLRARCITALARAVYPDLAMGLYDPDEVQPEPVYAGPAEVVQPEPARPEPAKPAAPPPAPPSNGTFSRLVARLDSAVDVADVNTVAREVGKAFKAGQLTAGELESLKGAVLRRRERLAAPPPPPVVEDADPDAGEADAEDYHAQFDGGES